MTTRNCTEKSHQPSHPGTARRRRWASAKPYPGRWAVALLLPLLLAPESGGAQATSAAGEPGLQVCPIIVEARAVPGGAALRFHETTDVNFKDSLGNQGYINGRQVIRYPRAPNGPSLPAESTLIVQSGTQLTLSEHHFGCTVGVETLDGRTVLKIRMGFSYPGIPVRIDEGVVTLQ